MKKQEIIDSIRERKTACWAMAQAFLSNRDAHGLHDIGVEIEALERAEKELEKLDV